VKVEFVSVTQPAPRLVAQGIRTAEDLIAYEARVSSPSKQLETETAPRLLAYLIRNRHWSPFDQVDFCVELETSRAISAQFIRHWSICIQEHSMRYATGAIGFEVSEARGPVGASNRQGSADNLSDEVKEWWRSHSVAINEFSQEFYDMAIEKGIAPEVARFVLPLSTRTRLFAKATVRDWIHYFGQRLDHHAQQEHRELATEIFKLFSEHFPAVVKAVEIDRERTTFDLSQVEQLRKARENQTRLIDTARALIHNLKSFPFAAEGATANLEDVIRQSEDKS
jgi:thymidylate synthase (FAD)